MAVGLGTTTAVESLASRGNGICSSRSDEEEDRSNCGNGGNSINPECGRDHHTLHDVDGTDNDDDGGNNQCRQPWAMLLCMAAQHAYPES